jgi:hypothetical protein
MIFINGREVDLQLLTSVYDDLEDWVKLDIELAGKPVPPPLPKPPSGTPSAAPSGTPSAAPSVKP